MAVNRKKYQNAILYLCRRIRGLRGKKKLAKLLYFVDFDLYEKEQRSLTGDRYYAFPMGPVPSALEKITGEMTKKGILAVEQKAEHEGYLPTEIYKCMAEPDLPVFDDEERSMLDRVVLKYGHLTGKQLEELSYAEAPYAGTKLREEIPYELTYYRGTDFGEA